MKRKIIILTIILLTLTLILVACGNNEHLNKSAEVTINIERTNNLPQEEKLDIAVSNGEFTYDGINKIVVKLKKIINTKVSISANGYKTVVVNIGAKEALDGKVMNVKFGEDYSATYAVIIGNRDLNNITTLIEGSAECVIDNNKLNIKHINTNKPFEIKISADNYEEFLLTNDNINKNKTLILTPLGNLRYNITKESSYDNDPILLDEHNMFIKHDLKIGKNYIFFIDKNVKKVSLYANNLTIYTEDYDPNNSTFSDRGSIINNAERVTIIKPKQTLPSGIKYQYIYGVDEKGKIIKDSIYCSVDFKNVTFTINSNVKKILCFNNEYITYSMHQDTSYLAIDIQDFKSDLSSLSLTKINKFTLKLYSELSGFKNGFSVAITKQTGYNEDSREIVSTDSDELEISTDFTDLRYILDDNEQPFNVLTKYMEFIDNKLYYTTGIKESIDFRLQLTNSDGTLYRGIINYQGSYYTPNTSDYYDLPIHFNTITQNSNGFFDPNFSFNISIGDETYSIAGRINDIQLLEGRYTLRVPLSINKLLENVLLLQTSGTNIFETNTFSYEGNAIVIENSDEKSRTIISSGDLTLRINGKTYILTESQLKANNTILIDIDEEETVAHSMHQITIIIQDEYFDYRNNIQSIEVVNGKVYVSEYGLLSSKQSKFKLYLNNDRVLEIDVKDATLKSQFSFNANYEQSYEYYFMIVNTNNLIIGDRFNYPNNYTITSPEAYIYKYSYYYKVEYYKPTIDLSLSYPDENFNLKEKSITLTLPEIDYNFDSFVYIYNTDGQKLGKYVNDNDRVILPL